MSLPSCVAQLPQLHNKYEALIIELMWGLLVLYLVIPQGSLFGHPILFVIALLWIRQFFCDEPLAGWASKSLAKTLIFFAVWFGLAVIIVYLLDRFLIDKMALFFNSLINDASTKLTLLIERDLLPIVIFGALSASVIGILFAAVVNQNRNVFKLLRVFSLPLLIISAYLLADNLANYDEEQLPTIIIQIILLSVSVILALYNRIKLATSRQNSRTYHLLLATELVINLNNVLLPLLMRFYYGAS